ncbi:MAG: S8 family serine peptidase [Thermoplasmata archaeon]|nr:S8 family serine peptidase [Thermoplasmata archaeon]
MRAIALLLVGLMTIGGAMPVPAAAEPWNAESTQDDANRLQRGLAALLDSAAPDDRFEVLVQFYGPLGPGGDDALERRGFEVLRTLDRVNGVFVEGPKAAILDLAEDGRVRYIEHNAPLVCHMNVTTATINAVDVWERTVLRDGGIPETIDGTGVTVVVLDSGIDATHPDLPYTRRDIENGVRPAEGDKVIFNAKKDQDVAGEPWLEFIDTDTTSGHGTHCAGTVAGTGAASAGGKKGVAPNAWLIGLSMGELFMTIDEYAGLEWVYYHSRPNDNPANIRVVTNSWGPGFPFDNLDPTSASVRLAERIVIDNNVAVVFAAGNDGENDHDGGSNTVNPFVFDTAATIGVAATERDGSGLATFTSRGDRDDQTTWPDVGAPGVGIWSAAARATLIGGLTGGSDILENDRTDPYYFSISGTSMATPHVAGVCALLWQACPSLRMSDVMEEGYTDNGLAPDEFSMTEPNPHIHETELIMKLTADYIEPSEQDEVEGVAENGVPRYNETGVGGRIYDFAQGYGMVNASRAVALALVLDRLRDPDHDGEAERDVTVFDALDAYMDVYREEMVSARTDVIVDSWSGEFVQPWTLVGEVNGTPVERHMPYALLYHRVYVPQEAVALHIVLEVQMLTGTDPSLASLYVTIDSDGDGETDWSPDGEPSVLPRAVKEWEVAVGSGHMMSDRGGMWAFNVTGISAGISSFGNGFHVTVEISLDSALDPRVERPGFAFGETPSESYPGGITAILMKYYDLRSPGEDDGKVRELFMDGLPLVVIIACMGTAGYIFWTRRRRGGAPPIEGPPAQ